MDRHWRGFAEVCRFASVGLLVWMLYIWFDLAGQEPQTLAAWAWLLIGLAVVTAIMGSWRPGAQDQPRPDLRKRVIACDEVVYGPFHMERMSNNLICFRIGDMAFDLEAAHGVLTWTPQSGSWEELVRAVDREKQT